MPVVRAAGGVVLRTLDGRAEILLVHRPRYDDWTLPKGKAKRDESDEMCALREVEEETGLVCELGAEVAVTEYRDAAGRLKQVRYFAMTPSPGQVPAAQNEVDDVRWAAPSEALAMLSYARDFDVVKAASALAAR